MAISILLGGDDHTGGTGPYERMLKSRKWLVIVSTMLLLTVQGYVDFEAINDAFPYVEIVREPVTKSLLLLLYYLFTIFVMLIWQYTTVHRTEMSDRLSASKREQTDALIEKIDASSTELERRIIDLLDAAKANIEPMEARIKSLDNDISTAQSELEALRKRTVRDFTRERTLATGLSSLRSEKGNLADELLALTDGAQISTSDNKCRALKARIDELYKHLNYLIETRFDSNKTYVEAEYQIDILRISVPFIISLLTLGFSSYRIFYPV